MRSSGLIIAACSVTLVAAWRASTGAAVPLSPAFLGINNGAVEVRQFSLTDTRLQAATIALGAGVFRYPTGTGSGYWNWRLGCVAGDAACGKVNNTVAALAAYVAATGVEPILAVNMLTDTLASQLEFLAAVAAAGIPVTRVELGNEYYLQNADYVKAFPTAADYGTAATQWAAAITAAHPGATVAAIASPVKPGKAPPRQQGWNAGVFSTLRGVSVVTMHEYTDTGIGKTGPLTAADVPVVLGAPFLWTAAIAAQTATLPASLSGGVWVTEFNLKDDQVTGVAGTWAHGLYVAAEAALLLAHAANASSPSARVTLAVPWECLGDGSMGSLFATAMGFNFTGSPNPALPTAPYNRSASGFSLSVFAAASRGRASAAPLSFSPNPPAHGPNGLVYGTLVGVAFGGGDSAVVLNLGAAPYSLDVHSISTSVSRFEVAHAAPLSAVNADAVVSLEQGAIPAGGSLVLPAYSVTALTSAP